MLYLIKLHISQTSPHLPPSCLFFHFLVVTETLGGSFWWRLLLEHLCVTNLFLLVGEQVFAEKMFSLLLPQRLWSWEVVKLLLQALLHPSTLQLSSIVALLHFLELSWKVEICHRSCRFEGSLQARNHWQRILCLFFWTKKQSNVTTLLYGLDCLLIEYPLRTSWQIKRVITRIPFLLASPDTYLVSWVGLVLLTKNMYGWRKSLYESRNVRRKTFQKRQKTDGKQSYKKSETIFHKFVIIWSAKLTCEYILQFSDPYWAKMLAQALCLRVFQFFLQIPPRSLLYHSKKLHPISNPDICERSQR